jgi:hypothetical protein
VKISLFTNGLLANGISVKPSAVRQVTTTLLEAQEGPMDSFEDESTAALPLRFAQPRPRAVLPKLALHFVKVADLPEDPQCVHFTGLEVGPAF